MYNLKETDVIELANGTVLYTIGDALYQVIVPENVDSIIIPDGITDISDPFCDISCKHVKSITIPNSVKTISLKTFECLDDDVEINIDDDTLNGVLEDWYHTGYKDGEHQLIWDGLHSYTIHHRLTILMNNEYDNGYCKGAGISYPSDDESITYANYVNTPSNIIEMRIEEDSILTRVRVLGNKPVEFTIPDDISSIEDGPFQDISNGLIKKLIIPETVTRCGLGCLEDLMVANPNVEIVISDETVKAWEKMQYEFGQDDARNGLPCDYTYDEYVNCDDPLCWITKKQREAYIDGYNSI